MYDCYIGIWEEIDQIITNEESVECCMLAGKCKGVNPNPSRKSTDPYSYDPNKMLNFGLYLGKLEFKYGMSLPKQKKVSFTDT